MRSNHKQAKKDKRRSIPRASRSGDVRAMPPSVAPSERQRTELLLKGDMAKMRSCPSAIAYTRREAHT